MKNLKILFILLSVLLFSCEDLLEKNPSFAPSAEGYFTSEKAVQESRIGLYSRVLNANIFTEDRWQWDALTDQLYAQYNWNNILNIYRGSLTPDVGGVVFEVYADAYQVISTANDHIGTVEGMDDNLFVDRTKERYLADGRFFRAFFYFYLTELYGAVPFYTAPLTSVEESKVAKTAKAEIVEFILNDLDLAIEHLPEKGYDGFITRGAAQALKARILLQNKRWEEAAAEAMNIINSGQFSLDPSYFDIFIKKGQPTSQEIIFAVEYLVPNAPHSLGRSLVHSAGGTPRQEFVDSYLMADGQAPGVSPLESSDYQNRDPRFYHSVYHFDDPWVEIAQYEPTQTGWYIKKFFDPDITDDNSLHIPGTNDQSMIQFRYADVLLIYAEAMQMLGNFNQGVYDQTIGPIRNRTGMGNVDVSAMSDAEKMDLIKYERNVELAFEGHRILDLKRWDMLGTTLLSLTDPEGQTINWQDHFLLWPFPRSEQMLNPNLVQNENYN